MVGEPDGPDCGWCCWGLLAKSGWRCAAGAPETANRESDCGPETGFHNYTRSHDSNELFEIRIQVYLKTSFDFCDI